MENRQRFIFLYLAGILLFSFFISGTLNEKCGASQPLNAHFFQGYANYAGAAQAGKTVIATLDGVQFSTTSDSTGFYNVGVSKCGNSSATAITFTVCSNTAAQNATFSEGAHNLTANLTITSACSSGDSGTGGGSGGGGGSSGGGGAGGGVGTVVSQTVTTGTIAAGGTAKAQVTQSGIAVTSVEITITSGVTGSSVTVSDRGTNKGTASMEAITADEGKSVYRYLEITADKIVNSNIEKAIVKFKVPKTAGYDSSTVELRRYLTDSKKWVPLTTKMVKEDDKNYYFEAETPGFSLFAVVGKKTLSAFQILDIISEFYAGTSAYSAFEIIDIIKSFYGG